MTFSPGGLVGLGGPEVLAILVLGGLMIAGLVGVVGLIARAVTKKDRISRYCPKCGRGLTQQLDAPFCSYCGNRLP